MARRFRGTNTLTDADRRVIRENYRVIKDDEDGMTFELPDGEKKNEEVISEALEEMNDSF